MDGNTEQTVLILAGVGKEGTEAAGEFVTESKYFSMLDDKALRGWQQKNIQVVIGTDVIRGSAGPPRIIELHFW